CLCHLEEWLGPTAKDAGYRKDIKPMVMQAVNLIKNQKEMTIYGGADGEKALFYAIEGISRMLQETRNTPWQLVIRRLPIITKIELNRATGKPGKSRQPERPEKPSSSAPPRSRQTPTPTPTTPPSGPKTTPTPSGR
ncbi:MAG: hypothetical protein AB1599_10665, partial [Planctomycetota bacterium]